MRVAYVGTHGRVRCAMSRMQYRAVQLHSKVPTHNELVGRYA